MWDRPKDSLIDAVHELDTCDYCPWVITGYAAYLKHLKREHPEKGEP